MTIVNDFKNNLLKRREIEVVVQADKNPGLDQAKKLVAEQIGVSEEVVAVKTLTSRFGRDTFTINAFVYDSLKDKEQIEPKLKKAKEEKIA
jgi:ribosomal protein S24E